MKWKDTHLASSSRPLCGTPAQPSGTGSKQFKAHVHQLPSAGSLGPGMASPLVGAPGRDPRALRPLRGPEQEWAR